MVQPLLGDVDAGKGMGNVVDIVEADPASAALLGRKALGRPPHVTVLLHEAQRGADGVRLVPELADAEVHLEEGKTHLHALLQRLAHGLTGVLAAHVGIAIDADLVAELAAQHLVDGHAIGFARDIPEGQLDATDAAGLASMMAELLDAAEDLVDVAGVLAQDAALEHQGIALAAAIAHLAIAHQALVGVDLDQRAGHGGADVGDAHVGDAQFGGFGVRVDVIQRLFVIRLFLRHL